MIHVLELNFVNAIIFISVCSEFQVLYLAAMVGRTFPLVYPTITYVRFCKPNPHILMYTPEAKVGICVYLHVIGYRRRFYKGLLMRVQCPKLHNMAHTTSL